MSLSSYSIMLYLNLLWQGFILPIQSDAVSYVLQYRQKSHFHINYRNGHRYHKQIDVDAMYTKQELEQNLDLEAGRSSFHGFDTEPRHMISVVLGYEAECALRETVVEILYPEKLLQTEPKTTAIVECIGECYTGGCSCVETDGLNYLLEVTEWNYSYPEGYTNKFIKLHNATSCECLGSN